MVVLGAGAGRRDVVVGTGFVVDGSGLRVVVDGRVVVRSARIAALAACSTTSGGINAGASDPTDEAGASTAPDGGTVGSSRVSPSEKGFLIWSEIEPRGIAADETSNAPDVIRLTQRAGRQTFGKVRELARLLLCRPTEVP